MFPFGMSWEGKEFVKNFGISRKKMLVSTAEYMSYTVETRPWLGSHHLHTTVVSTSPAESQQVKICVHCSTPLASSCLTRLYLVPGTATRATLKIYCLRADRKACRWPSEVVAEPMPIRYDFVSIRAHPALAGKRSVCASSASCYCDEHLSKADETITCEQATYER